MAKERNYATFFALLKRLPHVDKAELVDRWTAGRTTSLREMSDIEYRRMLSGLKSLVNGGESLKAARSKALHQLQLYGVDTTDWEHVNAFVLQPRIAGKLFIQMTIEELKALTRKMRVVNSKKPTRKLEENKEKSKLSARRLFVPRPSAGEA